MSASADQTSCPSACSHGADTQGRYALTDEFCAHRGISLWFGRNEENGLRRLVNHGWKYDHTGQCIDVPSEPEESGFCKKIKLKSYPLIERGGVLWTYMGPPELQSPPPEWEFAMVPRAQSITTKRIQECNWLQALEGGIDSSHVSFLHRGDLDTDPMFKGAKGKLNNLGDSRPVFEVVESPGGLYIGARRNAEEENTTGASRNGDADVHDDPSARQSPGAWTFLIPADDENCWTWSYDYHPTKPLSPEIIQAVREGKGIHVTYIPGTFRPTANKDNDYLMDRAAQKRGETYCGVAGFAMQDASVQESMGPIVDRSKENLVSTDNGIIMMRHRLLRALKAMEKGEMPPGVDLVHQRVRSAAVVLPPDQPFKDAAKEALIAKPGVAPASV
jgi:phenylpropionate dioxygenase-like ring-hydroxylating dioxygenase large terminal subunit